MNRALPGSCRLGEGAACQNTQLTCLVSLNNDVLMWHPVQSKVGVLSGVYSEVLRKLSVQL